LFFFDIADVLGRIITHMWWILLRHIHLTMTETSLSHVMSLVVHAMLKFVCFLYF